MAYNLIDQRILIGKTKDEVLDILGEPQMQGKDFISYRVDTGGIQDKIGLVNNYVVLQFHRERFIVEEVILGDT